MKKMLLRFLLIPEFAVLFIFVLYWICVCWWFDVLLWFLCGKWKITFKFTSPIADKVFRHMWATLDGEPKGQIFTIERRMRPFNE